MVVDDQVTMRRMIRAFLAALGYKDVIEVGDAESALPVLRQGGIDFLITDWNMPGMPGLELLKQVRSDPNLKNLPVLLLTAEAKREQIVAAAQAGVSGYIVKPFTEQVLKDKIEKILAGRTA